MDKVNNINKNCKKKNNFNENNKDEKSLEQNYSCKLLYKKINKNIPNNYIHDYQDKFGNISYEDIFNNNVFIDLNKQQIDMNTKNAKNIIYNENGNKDNIKVKVMHNYIENNEQLNDVKENFNSSKNYKKFKFSYKQKNEKQNIINKIYKKENTLIDLLKKENLIKLNLKNYNPYFSNYNEINNNKYDHIIFYSSKPVIAIYLNSQYRKKLQNLKKKKIIKDCIQFLKKNIPIIKIKKAYFYDWNNNCFSRGINSYFKKKSLLIDKDILSFPINRLLFAGEHTYNDDCNSLVSSFLSGKREAYRIIEKINKFIYMNKLTKSFYTEEKMDYKEVTIKNIVPTSFVYIYDDEIIGLNKKEYNNWFKNIRCIFCNNTQKINKQFIGIITIKKINGGYLKYTCHKNCFYLNNYTFNHIYGNRYFNLTILFNHLYKKKCSVCLMNFPSLKCSVFNCKNFIHLTCAYNYLSWPNFYKTSRHEILYCYQHQYMHGIYHKYINNTKLFNKFMINNIINNVSKKNILNIVKTEDILNKLLYDLYLSSNDNNKTKENCLYILKIINDYKIKKEQKNNITNIANVTNKIFNLKNPKNIFDNISNINENFFKYKINKLQNININNINKIENEIEENEDENENKNIYKSKEFNNIFIDELLKKQKITNLKINNNNNNNNNIEINDISEKLYLEKDNIFLKALNNENEMIQNKKKNISEISPFKNNILEKQNDYNFLCLKNPNQPFYLLNNSPKKIKSFFDYTQNKLLDVFKSHKINEINKNDENIKNKIITSDNENKEKKKNYLIDKNNIYKEKENEDKNEDQDKNEHENEHENENEDKNEKKMNYKENKNYIEKIYNEEDDKYKNMNIQNTNINYLLNKIKNMNNMNMSKNMMNNYLNKYDIFNEIHINTSHNENTKSCSSVNKNNLNLNFNKYNFAEIKINKTYNNEYNNINKNENIINNIKDIKNYNMNNINFLSESIKEKKEENDIDENHNLNILDKLIFEENENFIFDKLKKKKNMNKDYHETYDISMKIKQLQIMNKKIDDIYYLENNTNETTATNEKLNKINNDITKTLEKEIKKEIKEINKEREKYFKNNLETNNMYNNHHALNKNYMKEEKIYEEINNEDYIKKKILSLLKKIKGNNNINFEIFLNSLHDINKIEIKEKENIKVETIKNKTKNKENIKIFNGFLLKNINEEDCVENNDFIKYENIVKKKTSNENIIKESCMKKDKNSKFNIQNNFNLDNSHNIKINDIYENQTDINIKRENGNDKYNNHNNKYKNICYDQDIFLKVKLELENLYKNEKIREKFNLIYPEKNELNDDNFKNKLMNISLNINKIEKDYKLKKEETIDFNMKIKKYIMNLHNYVDIIEKIKNVNT